MKNIIIGLMMLTILVVALVYLSTTEDSQPTPTTSQPSEVSTTTTPVTEQTNTQDPVPPDSYRHAEPAHQYTIVLPHTVDVSSPQENITRYRYVGPESEANTEITDGYTLTIRAEATTATSLEAVVAGTLQQNRSDPISGPTEVQLGDHTALRYTTQSELGNRTMTVHTFLPGNGYSYRVSTLISPPDTTEYQAEVNRIMQSLTFVDQATANDLASRIVPIAMLDYEAESGPYIRESTGPNRGCDSVVLIEHLLPSATSSVLHASLEQLFAYEREQVAGWQNFIVSQNDTLTFERAEIENGEARIYLRGELSSLGGVCDNPRATIQIEETARAYDTVDTVQIYLNGEATDLTPDGR